jgi:sulfate adenylyltransferase subunit 1
VQVKHKTTFNRGSIDLLRFSVIGSVDDGKSTLIGRLLYDSDSILKDQLAAIQASSERRGDEGINLALLTDGLRAEREQGITIDVAYRYFATRKRKFIISDCPGHIEYTRNMVTGASKSHLSILLVDARKGIVEQTKRHTFVASLMNTKHLVLCVNKMDLVEFSEERFEEIKHEFLEFVSKLGIPDIQVIPVAATLGDNVINPSKNMDWYQGSSLLYTLENVHIGGDHNLIEARFPIQRVIRPHNPDFLDFRGYAGRVEGGVFKPGDEVLLLPSELKTRIKKIQSLDCDNITEAYHPMSVVITLEDEMDLSRGDFLTKPNRRPHSTQDLRLIICWFNKSKLRNNGKYLLKHTTNETRCKIQSIEYKVDIETLHRSKEKEIGMNDIAHITVRTSKPLFTDKFKDNKQTGSIIIIDEFSNETLAAGMIV